MLQMFPEFRSTISLRASSSLSRKGQQEPNHHPHISIQQSQHHFRTGHGGGNRGEETVFGDRSCGKARPEAPPELGPGQLLLWPPPDWLGPPREEGDKTRAGQREVQGSAEAPVGRKEAVVAHPPGRNIQTFGHRQRRMIARRVWGCLLAVTLLAGPAAAQTCRPLPTGVKGRNLAWGKLAQQSSIHQHDIVGSADKAVDGNCNGDWYNKSCTHTKKEKNPWWYVDLGESHKISVVIVKNRVDCCGERLYRAEVHLGDSLKDHGRSNPRCGTILNTSPGSITTIYCNGQRGRYVSVHLPRVDYLTVCEVEAYCA
ncbi:hypothetical protein NXF25_007651 [Crotalus adamanteus]|uniref:F5/8 type C domain-containing protein n=1 Tax=Crotalus adamanteus TaxID=8729 RepID=A0AAW1BKU4_CROAD